MARGPKERLIIQRIMQVVFAKHIGERQEIDWSRYRVDAMYGGEGMSESMRKHLLGYYRDVLGSYGASDLEINISHETDFTIALRRELESDPALRAELLMENHGILPMIFQYNPFDYLFETNAAGELLVTIARKENLSPRVRYNIHDLGHAVPYQRVRQILQRHGKTGVLRRAEFDFGLLFHYGRSDLSVDYNGATVGPEEVRQVLEASEFSAAVSTFRLISYEDAEAHKHLLLALELNAGADLDEAGQQALLAHLVAELRQRNLDFASALRTAPFPPELRVFGTGAGIFDAEHSKLKNDYIWNIDSERAKAEGIIN